MSTTRKKYDVSTPEASALINEIMHGTFLKEGTIVAFPTCFPGASVPIPADESHITALDTTPDGAIYGGAGGRLVHLFSAKFHGVTGAVFDMGTVEGATDCPAVCCGKTKVIACVNGPRGGRVIAAPLMSWTCDLIQEWGFSRTPFQHLGEPVPGEPILHAVVNAAREVAVGITPSHLFTVDIEASKVETIAKIAGSGRIALASAESIVGMDPPDCLWRYDVPSRRLERNAVKLPSGLWEPAPLTWAKDAQTGLLYTADAEGRLFSFSEQQGFSPPLAQVSLTPVGPMAVTFDGRLFGFCGDGIANMFCYNPHTANLANLGVAVSLLERRRYGYTFADAVTGRDGQIIFGENDNLGHLWLYFPKIQPRHPSP